MKYTVKVKPGSSQEKVVLTDDGELTVWLHARAHDGEANKAVVKVLAKYFRVSKSCIELVRGEKSRIKIVEIQG